MKIIFMGTPDFAVPSLEVLNEKYEIVLVVAQPDKEVGRKRILTHPPVVLKAIELGLPVFQPNRLRDDYKRIVDFHADMIVTAAYGQIVPDEVLNSVKYAINVHASLLPKYRGGAPIQRSIMAGEKESGISIIEMVSKLDAGRIFAQSKVEILDSDNSTTMFDKLKLEGSKLLSDVIEDIYNDNIRGYEQNEDEVIYSPNIKREEEKISWNKKSAEIFNLIRGLADEPGAYTIIGDTPIKIYSSRIVEYSSNDTPGTILDLNKKILVKTLDGAIEILTLKPSGKNKMTSKDFLNGQKLIKVNDIFD